MKHKFAWSSFILFVGVCLGLAAWPGGANAFSIEFDFRFANGYFDDPVRRRYRGLPFQPWAARIRFNTHGFRPWFFDATPQTAADIPGQTHSDFFGTAIHELAHALGLQSKVRAFRRWVKDDHFPGPKAMAWNDGKPVSLKKGSLHIRRGFARGLPRPHIDNYSTSGMRFTGC